MNKTLGIVILVAGIVLLVYGFNAMDSFGSHVSKAVNGAPSNKSMMLLVSGAILAVFGAFSTFRGER
jgi:uncharacterized membrane protein YjjB (DUF3815 family)